VRLVAYVMKVKKGGKESVNCGQSSAAFIDFHVVLVPTKTSTECASVTAEVIPHFRPTTWSAAAINTPDVPMRFTGQLFVDASHKPCQNGVAKAGNQPVSGSWRFIPSTRSTSANSLRRPSVTSTTRACGRRLTTGKPTRPGDV